MPVILEECARATQHSLLEITMRVLVVPALLITVIAIANLPAQDEGQKITSGPQVGKLLPGPFDCLIINGPKKGRQHCLVCEGGLSPAVMIFAREPADKKDAGLTAL